MMNALSFPVAQTQAPGASTTSAPGSDGNKPCGDAFKQLLDDDKVPSQATNKNITDKPRPAAAKHASGTADEAAASEETTGKPIETAIQSSSDTSRTNNDDDNIIDAPWPPPGLSMIAQAATPAVVPEASTQLAATLPMPASLPMQAPVQPTESMFPIPTSTPATTPATSLLGALANGITLPATPVSEAMRASEEAAPTIETAASLLTGTPINTTEDGDAAAPTPSFVHLLQGVTAPASAARVEPTPFTGTLAAPVAANAPDFDEAISARVGWLADQKIGHAHIRVTPNDMGPVEVRLQLDGDRVHASFTSAHADVRHALESSLPKLREMLCEQGLELAHADVGQHSDPRANDGNTQAGGTGGDAGPGAATAETHTPHTLRLRGLLDTYA